MTLVDVLRKTLFDTNVTLIKDNRIVGQGIDVANAEKEWNSDLGKEVKTLSVVMGRLTITI